MAKGLLEIDGSTAKLSIKGKTYSQSKDGAKQLFCLLVGSDVQSNDSNCYLVQFDDELWLLPELTPGLPTLKNWFNGNSANKVTIASIDYLPYAWRAIYGFIPSTEPKLKVLPSPEINKILPKLKIHSDMSFNDVL